MFDSLSERSVGLAEWLALPTSDHGVAGSNPAGSEILPEPKRRFIAQSLSCSPFHCLEMTEILLKGCKTLTHPSLSEASSNFPHCVCDQQSSGNTSPGHLFDYTSTRTDSIRGARWLSGRVSDSRARGRGFETYHRRVVSLSKTLYSPKVLVNYPGSGGSVPT